MQACKQAQRGWEDEEQGVTLRIAFDDEFRMQDEQDPAKRAEYAEQVRVKAAKALKVAPETLEVHLQSALLFTVGFAVENASRGATCHV